MMMVEGSWLLFLIAVFFNTINMFCQVFFAVMYADLECDYVGPVEVCKRVNFFIVPEALFHVFTTGVFLVQGYWWTTLLNAPLVIYNGYKISQHRHLLSPTDVFRKLPIHKRECFTKLGFYVALFFVYMFATIATLISDDARRAGR